jgi:hypothetical protein
MTNVKTGTQAMSIHYTQFKRKTISVRNNVKNSMIKNFIHSLDGAIADRTTSISRIHSVMSGFVIPQYDKSNIDPLSVCNQPTDMPCLNYECQWVNYQTIFHPGRDIWQLPAVTDDGKCQICDLWDKRQLDISEITMSNKKRVVFSTI